MLKKVFTFFICLNMLASPAYCVIDDDFAQKTLSDKTKVRTLKHPNIKDNFAEQTLNKNLKTKEVNYQIINDTFAQNNKNKNQYTKVKVDFYNPTIVSSKKIIQPKKAIIISNENSIPLKIRIKKAFSTKQKMDEGDYLEFETLSEIKIKDKIYPAGTDVKARIETISYNKTMGVPSDLVVGNFSINGEPLKGEISKTGANRSLWLYPSVYMTTVFFGVGLLLIPIRGGHAKIKPHQIYTVYYSD